MKKTIVLILVLTVLVLALTACGNSDYEKAVKLMEAKDYEAAATLFAKIGNVKDSTTRLAQCNTMIDAINSFNDANAALSEKNNELDNAISTAQKLVQSKDKALDESLRPELETAISATKAVRVDLPDMPEEAAAINDKATEMNNVDYTEAITELQAHQDALDKSMRQYALVNNPTEEYVIRCLETVSGVTGISAATEDNDPNKNLGKAGGYTAAIFFSHEYVNQSELYGNTILEKGTDCGGQIEVYATEEDALRRDDYLSGYDGTVLASGSHKVIGTVLVRTSNILTASQQKEVETSIIEALTKLD